MNAIHTPTTPAAKRAPVRRPSILAAAFAAAAILTAGLSQPASADSTTEACTCVYEPQRLPGTPDAVERWYADCYARIAPLRAPEPAHGDTRWARVAV